MIAARLGPAPGRKDPPKYQTRTFGDLRASNEYREKRGMPRLHLCDGCGIIDEWGDSWSWYGSYAGLEYGEIATLCPECTEHVDEESVRLILDQKAQHDKDEDPGAETSPR